MDKDYKTCAECNAFTCELLKNNADAVNDLVKKYSVIPKEDYDLYIKPYLIMETLYNQRKNGGNMKNIELIEEAARPVIYIRTHTSVEKLPQVIGESYRKIASFLQSLGEQPTCVPYTEYYNLDMQDLEVEMGFPVARMLNGQGEIKAREIPSGRFVAYMHIGPYSQMEEPYREIEKWIQEKGLEKTGECYEYYYNSPQEVPESELKTKIMIPVKG